MVFGLLVGQDREVLVGPCSPSALVMEDREVLEKQNVPTFGRQEGSLGLHPI